MTDTTTGRHDLTPDMTPGACTHIEMIGHKDDPDRWTCTRCGLQTGSDPTGYPLRALHPLWPAEVVPGA